MLSIRNYLFYLSVRSYIFKYMFLDAVFAVEDVGVVAFFDDFVCG